MPNLAFSVDDEDLNLEIPFQSVSEEFQCPICFNFIKDCYMTRCGHNFCSKCIKECLNVRHACPSCMKDCTVSDLQKNLHFDRVVTILLEEKEVASKKYFEKLIEQGGEDPNSNNNNNPEQAPSKKLKNDLSPIEEIFHKHLKKSLGVYEEHYQQLCKKFENTKKQLEAENSEEKIQQLKNDFDENIRYLLKSYEDYMNDIKPAPKFLPLPVDIIIPSKKNWTHRYLLKPIDTAKDIRDLIESCFQKLNDNILEWNDENYLILENPTTQERSQLKELGTPLRHHVDTISKIIVNGTLKCKSDAPDICFSKIFEKGKDLSTNYYTCQECKLNWICESCSQHCHSGHTLKEFAMNNVPNFACCYCKRKKCLIFKKD